MMNETTDLRPKTLHCGISTKQSKNQAFQRFNLVSVAMVILWRVAAGLLLPLVPTLAVFGNALVIIAVYRERSLQTVTNMLIVSLAVSDFMVAICVMSFGVYYEWNGFKWEIGQFLCNVYLASDVTCSTASILNLLAISLDRYIAISHPISYAQYGARGGRAMLSISIVWGVSTVVGLPILFGINPMENDQCELGNPYFNILSSLFSFFLPCSAMIVLYTVIFRRLRQRERARSLRQATRQDNDRISSALLGGARIARQMGKHFKNRTDQILLEISFQTSSYPTMSDSSDDVSTITPMAAPELNFGPTTVIGRIPKPLVESESLPVMNGHIESIRADKERKMELAELQNSIEDVHKKCETMTRSFGDDLEELFPFIDSGSRKNSREDVRPPIKISNGRPELRSVSVHSLKDEKRLSQSFRLNDLRSDRRIINKSSLSDGLRNGSVKRKVTDVVSLPPRSCMLRPNGKEHHDIPKIHKSSPRLMDLLNNDDYSFSDSMRVYKNQLWKRVTTGWKTRPSRQLVKKATKQMRREHKATVTLAVVLAVFLVCWLPFFSMHLVNSICLISGHDGGCIPMLPLFLTTWLGYINSSLNPLIYTVFDQRFRGAFRNILSCSVARK